MQAKLRNLRPSHNARSSFPSHVRDAHFVKMSSFAELELHSSKANASLSKLGNQSPAVDFIDNRLHSYHEAFVNPPTQCDVVRGQYVPTAGSTIKQGLANSQRPTMVSIQSMDFWKEIFVPAMQSLKTRYPTEPKGRVESGHSIRGSVSWSDVWEKLTQAQESYDGQEGMTGSVRRGFRRFVDGSQRLNGTVALVPDSEFTTPIVSVLKALLSVSSNEPNTWRNDSNLGSAGC